MLAVRRATLDDVECMVAIYTCAWREGFRHMFSAAVFARDDFDTSRRDECLATVLQPDRETFVATADDRVVGFAVSRHVAEGVYLDDLWVHPESWGSGAAGALVAQVENDMRTAGGRRMTGWVPEDSPSGRRFVEKLGWRPTGAIEAMTVYPECPNRIFEYRRELASVDLTRGVPRPTAALQRR